MQKQILALAVASAFLAAPALHACDLEKSDKKVMNETQPRLKTAKHGKHGHKAVAKKDSDTSKI